MSLQCPKCYTSLAVGPDERPRPWCPHCGADVRNLDTSTAPKTLASATAVLNAPRVLCPAAPSVRDTERVNVRPAPPPVPAGSPEAPAELDVSERVFRPNVLWQAVFLMVALVCFAIAGAAGSQLLRPNAARPAKPAVIFALVGLFGVAGVALAYAGLRLLGMKYVVYPDRFVHSQNGKTVTYTWDQVREVVHQVQRGWQKFTVAVRKGRVLTLNGEVWNHTLLGNLIAVRTAQAQFPQAAATLESGQVWRFGPINADQTGLNWAGNVVPWDSIATLDFAFDPREKGPRKQISNMLHLRLNYTYWAELGEIPNYRLLALLIQHYQPLCQLAEFN